MHTVDVVYPQSVRSMFIYNVTGQGKGLGRIEEMSQELDYRDEITEDTESGCNSSVKSRDINSQLITCTSIVCSELFNTTIITLECVLIKASLHVHVLSSTLVRFPYILNHFFFISVRLSPSNDIPRLRASLTKSNIATQTQTARTKPVLRSNTKVLADNMKKAWSIRRENSLTTLNKVLKPNIVSKLSKNKTKPDLRNSSVKDGFKSRIGTIDNLLLARKPDNRTRHGIMARDVTFVQSSPFRQTDIGNTGWIS